MKTHKEEIINCIKNNRYITQKEICKIIGIRQQIISPIILDLEKKGRISKIGKGGRYIPFKYYIANKDILEKINQPKTEKENLKHGN